MTTATKLAAKLRWRFQPPLRALRAGSGESGGWRRAHLCGPQTRPKSGERVATVSAVLTVDTRPTRRPCTSQLVLRRPPPPVSLRELQLRHLEEQVGAEFRHGLRDAQPLGPAQDLLWDPAREGRDHRAMTAACRVLFPDGRQARPRQSTPQTHQRRP